MDEFMQQLQQYAVVRLPTDVVKVASVGKPKASPQALTSTATPSPKAVAESCTFMLLLHESSVSVSHSTRGALSLLVAHLL